MEVKTYEALSMKDAIKAIKNDLGPNAVILSSRPITRPESGTDGVEVKAAASLNVRDNNRTFNTTSSPVSPTIQKDLASISSQLNSLNSALNNISNQIPSRSAISSLESGLSFLKVILSDYVRKEDKLFDETTHRGIIDIYNYLNAQGLDAHHLSSLVSYLKGLTSTQDSAQNLHGGSSAQDYYKTHAMRWMLRRIRIMSGQDVTDSTSRIHVFFGSSSAGKTTTVCRLISVAAKRNLKFKVISLDSARIGADELLKVYCKINGVPFMSAGNFSELEKMLIALDTDEYAIIDTPSVSYEDHDFISSFHHLNGANIICDHHLVISLVDKQLSQERTISHFAPLGLTSLIFNKLDEAGSCGELINLPNKWAIPVSYLSLSADLSKPLEKASRERIVSRLFGI